MGVDQEDLISCIRFNLSNEKFLKGMIEFGDIKPNEFCGLPNYLEVGEPTKSGYPFNLVQLACVYKRDDVYTELLNHGGFPVEISEDQLRNALCYSAMYNQPDLTFALINFRAFDINMPGSDFSHNPLQLCLIHDSPAVVQILLEDERLDLARRVPRHAVNGHLGETPLHLACENDVTAALSVFLRSRKCDARIVNMRDFYGFTPFLVAVNAERLTCCLLLESTSKCNFNTKDGEGSDWSAYATFSRVEDYLTAYFRRVPSLQHIAARFVGELVRTERNLNELEITNAAKEVAGIYIEY